MRLRLPLLLLIATSALSAQRAPDTIRLDVIVEGVSGRQPLAAGDFQVTEAGQPVRLDAVLLVQPSAAPAALPATITDENEEAAASAAERLVAIYIDEYHLGDDQAFASSRAALAAFVRQDLGPRDLVVVLKPLDSLVAIRMTADRDAAARIVEGAMPRMGDYTARSAFEQNFIAGAPARIDAARSQIALSSVSALATHLGRFDAGRKTLIVMSNGFPAGAPVSRRDQVLPGLESITRLANRERVAIYAVQPTRPPAPTRDVAAASDPGTRDALSTLAEQTTGFVIGGDRLSEGLKRIAAESSHYYLLSLAAAERPADGRFRNVEVAVKRPGALVRARPGYVIGRPAAAVTRRPAIPEGLKVPRRSSPLIRTWFGQSAAEQGNTRVEFVWEPTPAVPGVARASSTPSRVTLAVTTLEGTPVFSGSTSASGGDAIVAAGQVPQLSFDVSPGSLLVRMDIYDASGRIVDHDVRDLVVARFDDPLTFGTAAFYRARTMPALRAIAEGRSSSAPVAARQFSRAEQLLVRMPVASRGGGADLTVTAQLESRFGSTLRELPVTQVSPSLVEVQLPLAGLASGGYALAFEARGGGAAARARVDFAVTP